MTVVRIHEIAERLCENVLDQSRWSESGVDGATFPSPLWGGARGGGMVISNRTKSLLVAPSNLDVG